MHGAANNGHTAAVSLLLMEGADIEAKQKEVDTALHRAALNGHTATVSLLLKEGADIEAKNNVSTWSIIVSIYGFHIIVFH